MPRLGSMLSLMACAALGWASEGLGQDLGDPRRGRLIAERDCAACHAPGRAGPSRVAAAPAFRELHKRYDVEDLAEALAEGIVTGHPAMPSKPYPPDDVRDLIAYLHTLEPRPRPKP
jgi:cytochrome c